MLIKAQLCDASFLNQRQRMLSKQASHLWYTICVPQVKDSFCYLKTFPFNSLSGLHLTNNIIISHKPLCSVFVCFVYLLSSLFPVHYQQGQSSIDSTRSILQCEAVTVCSCCSVTALWPRSIHRETQPSHIHGILCVLITI